MTDHFKPLNQGVLERFSGFSNSVINHIELRISATGSLTAELRLSAIDLQSEKPLPIGYFDHREVLIRVSDVSEYRLQTGPKHDDRVLSFGIGIYLRDEIAAIEFSGFPDFDPEDLNALCRSSQYILGTRLDYRILS